MPWAGISPELQSRVTAGHHYSSLVRCTLHRYTTNHFSPLLYCTLFCTVYIRPLLSTAQLYLSITPSTEYTRLRASEFINTIARIHNTDVETERTGRSYSSRGRIPGRNWDKSLKNFPSCYSQSTLLTDFTVHPPQSKSDLKLICNVNIVYAKLKSENSQDYA